MAVGSCQCHTSLMLLVLSGGQHLCDQLVKAQEEGARWRARCQHLEAMQVPPAARPTSTQTGPTDEHGADGGGVVAASDDALGQPATPHASSSPGCRAVSLSRPARRQQQQHHQGRLDGGPASRGGQAAPNSSSPTRAGARSGACQRPPCLPISRASVELAGWAGLLLSYVLDDNIDGM